jgi:MFS family permease
VICNPLFGAFSDRTTLRMGRRLPWIIGGALGGAASLAVLSVADNVVVMALGWCGVQATLNALLAAVTATVPDQVPVERRGRVGGILAVAQTLGVVCGTGIASATGSISAGYLATAAVLIALTVPFSLNSRDLPLPARESEPFDVRRFAASFWISPRVHPDFAWAWITRFLVNLGNALGLLYLLYFMQDVVGFSSDAAADRVFVLTAIYAGTLVLTTVVFGIWSDRVGRRKVFVIWSGVVAGTAAIILGVGQDWPAAVLGAAVMGCGYGIYTSVDFALITQVLPGAHDRAKDLGVINIANALPQVFAPILATVILNVVEGAGGVVETDGSGFSSGYFALYAFAFGVSLLGSVFVTRIRSVA